MSNLRIAVLFGGASSEYKVSLQSATSVLENLNREKYEVIPVGITHDGEWFHYLGDIEKIKKDTWYAKEKDLRKVWLSFGNQEGGFWEKTVEGRKKIAVDGVFPVLHGRKGEDGSVQGVLELAGLPVIGCNVLASALCMDKNLAHQIVSLTGIRVPKSVLIEEGETIKEEQYSFLQFPLFVKPLKAGSSFGITKVFMEEQLSDAIQTAFEYDNQVLIEENIEGFEVGCAVIGNQKLVTGRVDEIELSNGFFDYKEKYTLETSSIHMPARISSEKELEIQQAAKKIYQCLGCKVMARVDLFLTPSGELVFNEVNTIPGFTSHSRFPNMMKGVGMEFDQLLDLLISLGTE